MEDGVTLDTIDHADGWLGRYPESLMKIRHDLAEKKLFPGGVGVWVGVGVGFFVSLRISLSQSKILDDWCNFKMYILQIDSLDFFILSIFYT